MIPLAAVALVVTAGQGTADASIARQLATADARTIAWGAFNAGESHREDLAPALQQILEAPPAVSPSEEHAFIGVVMDALIQLNARLPASVLKKYAVRHPVQTLVLLSRATDRQAVVVDLLPQSSGFQWFAAANLLLADRASGLADHLIRTVHLRLLVVVVDREGLRGIGDGVSSASGSCGIGQDPSDYPPHAEYDFAMSAEPGALLVADGPHPVYYSRTLTRARQYPFSRSQISGPTDEERVTYLRSLVLDAGGPPFHADTSVTVRWSTAAAFERRVRELRGDVERRFRALVEQTRALYPLPADITTPPIDVRLFDRRRDTRAPLPKIAPED